MGHQASDHAVERAEQPAGAPRPRLIGRGENWSISEFTCHLGPGDRPFEERHTDTTIAAVVEGTFRYRSAAGQALLYPGAFLVGNAGAYFECGHDHGTGDRCIAFRFEAALFEEIAADIVGSRGFRFPTVMIPSIPPLMAPIVDLAMAAGSESTLALEQLAFRLAQAAIGVSSDIGPSASPSSKDQRRITNVLRYIEENAAEPLNLADLSAVAFMSKHHFLRTFRRIVGVTPHQFLLSTRMRRAATDLCTTTSPITDIAFDAGFGDLSTFNGRFRQVFGMSPGMFRRSRQRLRQDAPARPRTSRPRA